MCKHTYTQVIHNTCRVQASHAGRPRFGSEASFGKSQDLMQGPSRLPPPPRRLFQPEASWEGINPQAMEVSDASCSTAALTASIYEPEMCPKASQTRSLKISTLPQLRRPAATSRCACPSASCRNVPWQLWRRLEGSGRDLEGLRVPLEGFRKGSIGGWGFRVVQKCDELISSDALLCLNCITYPPKPLFLL